MNDAHIRFYVIPEGISCKVFNWTYIVQVGMNGEDSPDLSPEANIERGKAAAHQAFHERGTWHEVWLKEASGLNASRIEEMCRVSDDRTGFRYDLSLEPAARYAVMIERWNGFPVDSGDTVEKAIAARQALKDPINVALDKSIQILMYPDARTDPDFFGAWKSKQPDSEKKSPST